MKVDPDPMLEEDHAPEHLSPGTELLGGIYTIRQFLARGGFGITYLAQDSLDRAVVIKECFPVDLCDRDIETGCVEPTVSPDDFDRLVRSFYREAKSLSRLKHQNVIQVHNVFGENGTAFIAMDYVDGCDLFDVIESASPLRTPRTVISMLRQLLDALAYIHDQGMLHRDISPDNVLVNDDGVPVLIDFGAADTQDAHTQRIRTRLHAVKDGYSPQELYIQGLKQTPAADIYGLGATFYHLISGEAPPPSQSRLQAAGMGDADPYQPLAGQVATYPDGLLRTIDRALAIRPADRFQNAEDWLKELDDELGNENIVTLRQVRSIVEAEAQDETSAPTDPEPTAPLPRPSSAAQSRAKPRKRGWGIAGATAAFAATVAAVAVFVEIPQVSGPAVFLPQQQTEAVAAAPRSVGSIPVLAAPEAQTATQLALPRDSQHTATARAPVMPASGNPVIVASMPAIEAIDPLGATRSILVEAPAKAETASIPATAERDDVPLVFARTTETAPARPAQSGSRSRQDAPVALNAEANRVVASLTSEGPPVFSANTVNAAADNIRTAARHPFATVADAVVPALEQRTNDLAMRPEPVSLANADALAQTLRGAPLDPAQRLTETFAAPPEAGTTAPQVPTTSSTPLTRPPLPEVTSLERLARASGITEGQIAQSPNLGLARIGADQPVFLSGVGSLGRPDAGASYVDRIGPKRIPVRMRNVSVPVAPLLVCADPSQAKVRTLGNLTFGDAGGACQT
ncbi:MAG: protein kinase, partial [Pseudomonadota bacterium]